MGSLKLKERNVAKTKKIESQASIEFKEIVQSLVELGSEIDAKGLNTHPDMDKILQSLSAIRMDFLHMLTNKKNLAQ